VSLLRRDTLASVNKALKMPVKKQTVSGMLFSCTLSLNAKNEFPFRLFLKPVHHYGGRGGAKGSWEY
jgi:hypothetical protein